MLAVVCVEIFILQLPQAVLYARPGLISICCAARKDITLERNSDFLRNPPVCKPEIPIIQAINTCNNFGAHLLFVMPFGSLFGLKRSRARNSLQKRTRPVRWGTSAEGAYIISQHWAEGSRIESKVKHGFRGQATRSFTKNLLRIGIHKIEECRIDVPNFSSPCRISNRVTWMRKAPAICEADHIVQQVYCVLDIFCFCVVSQMLLHLFSALRQIPARFHPSPVTNNQVQ
mmetsp:Transcript_94454/g.172912  ORF Transcript_94454/g.172912 Transcript_94454/m.172912 type:complete len:230 (-) Transcript_94454:764-1453(-)